MAPKRWEPSATGQSIQRSLKFGLKASRRPQVKVRIFLRNPRVDAIEIVCNIVPNLNGDLIPLSAITSNVPEVAKKEIRL